MPSILPASMLALAMLAFGAATPVMAQVARAPTIVPDPSEIEIDGRTLPAWIRRYRADLDSVLHVHDIATGLRREAALRTLHQGWLERLSKLDATDLDLEDRIDRLLFERALRQALAELDFEARRVV
ncbi:MAG TPA: hypothetical protein DDZ76_15890, partial [Xanthomonadales bacterium]|nr:hypothetical protein [Xanthomonadales bacterium]